VWQGLQDQRNMETMPRMTRRDARRQFLNCCFLLLVPLALIVFGAVMAAEPARPTWGRAVLLVLQVINVASVMTIVSELRWCWWAMFNLRNP
jgi:hypothetical protein